MLKRASINSLKRSTCLKGHNRQNVAVNPQCLHTPHQRLHFLHSSEAALFVLPFQKVKEVRNIVTGSVKSAVSITVNNAAQAQDLTTALEEVKAHYEALAQRSKQDALLSVQDSVSAFITYFT